MNTEKPEAVEKPEDAVTETKPKEDGGPSGPDPIRYGDWERNGIAVDF